MGPVVYKLCLQTSHHRDGNRGVWSSQSARAPSMARESGRGVSRTPNFLLDASLVHVLVVISAETLIRSSTMPFHHHDAHSSFSRVWECVWEARPPSKGKANSSRESARGSSCAGICVPSPFYRHPFLFYDKVRPGAGPYLGPDLIVDKIVLTKKFEAILSSTLTKYM